MPIVSSITLHWLNQGGTSKGWAEAHGYKPNNVTKVVTGGGFIREIELELIRQGLGPKLKKIQKEKGIFNEKRYKEMLAQVKKEKEATTNGNQN